MKQGKCITCRKRWVWTDYEVERDRALCPSCRGLLCRTTIRSPYETNQTTAYAVRSRAGEIVKGGAA